MSESDWLKTFPLPTAEERAKFDAGGTIPQYAAVAQYSRRTGIALGPSLLFFQSRLSGRLVELPEAGGER